MANIVNTRGCRQRGKCGIYHVCHIFTCHFFVLWIVTYMALHWLKEQDTKLAQNPQKQFQ